MNRSDLADLKAFVLVANHLSFRAASAQLGVTASAYTSESLAAPFLRTGQLVRVLESFSPTVDAFVLFYPGHRQVPAALRAFIDMIRASASAQGRRSLKNLFLPS